MQDVHCFKPSYLIQIFSPPEQAHGRKLCGATAQQPRHRSQSAGCQSRAEGMTQHCPGCLQAHINRNPCHYRMCCHLLDHFTRLREWREPGMHSGPCSLQFASSHHHAHNSRSLSHAAALTQPQLLHPHQPAQPFTQSHIQCTSLQFCFTAHKLRRCTLHRQLLIMQARMRKAAPGTPWMKRQRAP